MLEYNRRGRLFVKWVSMFFWYRQRTRVVVDKGTLNVVGVSDNDTFIDHDCIEIISPLGLYCADGLMFTSVTYFFYFFLY